MKTPYQHLCKLEVKKVFYTLAPGAASATFSSQVKKNSRSVVKIITWHDFLSLLSHIYIGEVLE